MRTPIDREFREVLKTQERSLDRIFCYASSYVFNPFDDPTLWVHHEVEKIIINENILLNR